MPEVTTNKRSHQRPPVEANLLALLRTSPDSPLPLAAQLRQQLEWLLTSGQIQPGDRLPPVRTLAAALGIHRHTVLAAYRQLEAAGRLNLRQGHGTTVLAPPAVPPPEQRPSSPTFTVGVLVPGLDPFYIPFLMGIDAAAAGSPWLPLVCYTHDRPDLTRRHYQQLLRKQVDGLILAAIVSDDLDLSHGHPPTVYVDDPTHRDNVVLLSSEQASFLATAHLIEHGHTRIGLVIGPLRYANISVCLTGYRQALQSAGLAFDPQLIVETTDFTIEAGRLAALKLLSLPTPPTAIFGSADMLAVGAMSAVQDSGRRVPQDVAIVGYDNIELAALVRPALTTASAASYEMGHTAMTMLLELMAGRRPDPSVVTLPTRLIIRQSCGCEAPKGRAS